MNDLVKDLRNPKTEGNCWRCFSAADKIESLQAEVERLRKIEVAAFEVYKDFDGLGHESVYALEDALSND